jgi:hypothetical protein
MSQKRKKNHDETSSQKRNRVLGGLPLDHLMSFSETNCQLDPKYPQDFRRALKYKDIKIQMRIEYDKVKRHQVNYYFKKNPHLSIKLRRAAIRHFMYASDMESFYSLEKVLPKLDIIPQFLKQRVVNCISSLRFTKVIEQIILGYTNPYDLIQYFCPDASARLDFFPMMLTHAPELLFPSHIISISSMSTMSTSKRNEIKVVYHFLENFPDEAYFIFEPLMDAFELIMSNFLNCRKWIRLETWGCKHASYTYSIYY